MLDFTLVYLRSWINEKHVQVINKFKKCQPTVFYTNYLNVDNLCGSFQKYLYTSVRTEVIDKNKSKQVNVLCNFL